MLEGWLKALFVDVDVVLGGFLTHAGAAEVTLTVDVDVMGVVAFADWS